MTQTNVKVGNVENLNGDFNLASRDLHIHKGLTLEGVEKYISKFEKKRFNGSCPYKGPDVFEEDAELFFGHKKLAGDLERGMKESRTVFNTGPLESEKSSLVQARLVHVLKQEWIKNTGLSVHNNCWARVTPTISLTS